MGLLKALKAAPWVLLIGCGIADGPSPALLAGPRIIAVQAEPAQAAPGDPVRLTAIVAGGILERLDWAWCTTPKPPTENNRVDPACLGDGVAPLGAAGLTIDATLPVDGCRLFGPESPGPGLRPRDPDVTGGYYQPVILRADAAIAVGLVRLRCNLSQAPLAIAQRFAAEYTPNQNPTLRLEQAPAGDAAGDTVRVEALTDPPERALRFDPAARALVEEEEALVVSWFVTGGALSAEQSRVEGGRAVVEWRAEGGPATLHAVVRDGRGGVAAQAIALSPP